MRQCRSSGRGASRAIVAGLALAAVALAPALGTVRADGPAKSKSAIEYNRDIRPILAENCFACHGPDSASRKADLRLDRRDAAVQAGAIAPGDVEQSELLHRIFSSDRDEVMPPPAIKKNLTAAQKDLLKQWIVSGAEYQPHWSLIAPTRPAPPTVKHEARVKNPIDRFVLSKLEARGLSPAPEADRLTLARRVSLDLTGLPPEPRDVDAFVADTSPDAYEKYVDRLLGSDRWGEHRARYWLDVARYADTHGIHFDNYRENWVYRDWVINAFNRNMPFDQFTLEQLAGDLLPGRTVDQQVASGFNRCNITTNEGGTIPEEYLVF
jgi:mono/diheme cytochrome c family protein